MTLRKNLIGMVLMAALGSVQSFTTSPPPQDGITGGPGPLEMAQGSSGGDANNDKPKNILDDLKGMFANLDDVIDDFVMKRMGAGEQWYGKRKYNPSGRIDGDYNGMGRSSHYSIEIARVQKEVMEERKQRRLEEEAAARQNQ